MPCLGGGPSRWEIDLDNQKDSTEKTIKLRTWLLNKSKLKDDFLVDMPDFEEEHAKQTSYNSSRGNPSSNQPWRVEAVITHNEQAKLCQLIRHIGEDKFYEIVDAAGLRSKQARDIVEFWQVHKKIDAKREAAAKARTKKQERKAAVNEFKDALANLSVDEIKQMTEQLINVRK